MKNLGPLPVYHAQRRKGALRHDPAQEKAIEALQAVYETLERHERGWRSWLGGLAPKAFWQRSAGQGDRGLYLYGDVGRGKSMLMDLFFDQVMIPAKRRVHFHAFMLEVQQRLHELHDTRDPLLYLAGEIAGQTRLLCFDEFEVSNVADAMILQRLFTALLAEGVIVVATSNTAPANLYEGGLQRERFLPFIILIENLLDVLALESETDYRLARTRGIKVYHTPLNAEAKVALEYAFERLREGAQAHRDVLTFAGRSLEIPRTARGTAFFTFDELCARPLGAADYLALAENFHTLIISGIPKMGEEKRNEARRFVVLIDALYEKGTELICSAETVPELLYEEGASEQGFKRAASRLHEMQSEEYLSRSHS